MLTPLPRRASGALEKLSPFLKPNAPARPLPAELLSRGLHEIGEKLTPIAPARLRQLLSRMTLHYPLPPGERPHRLVEAYAAALAHYPEDLLCAAYCHLLHFHPPGIMPCVGDIEAVIGAEYSHRLMLRRRLSWLARRAVAEACHERA